MLEEVWVILCEPSGPVSDFVEVENLAGEGVGGFEWVKHGNNWALGPFTHADALTQNKRLRESLEQIRDRECMEPSEYIAAYGEPSMTPGQLAATGLGKAGT